MNRKDQLHPHLDSCMVIMNETYDQAITVGVIFKDMTIEQQTLIEDQMILHLDAHIGRTSWRYRKWGAGVIEVDLDFNTDRMLKDDPSLIEQISRISAYSMSVMLSAVTGHANTRVLSWPTKQDIESHLQDSSYVIPPPAVGWAD